MTQVSSLITIHAPADDIWQVISEFGAADRYLVGVVTCRVEGEGIGALRTLTSVDGSKIVERLEELDSAAHRLSYFLLTDTPFADCLTSMAIRSLAQHQVELTWSATFEANGIPVSEAEQMLANALAENCLALKKFIENEQRWDDTMDSRTNG